MLESASKENLVPAKVAAEQVGYTTDYVTRLAREGKISAVREGGKWLVDFDETILFAQKAENEKLLRRYQLSAERKNELQLEDGGVKKGEERGEQNTSITRGRADAVLKTGTGS